MAENDGKKIEKATAQAFKKLMDGGKAVVTRQYDTKSAGFFLPPSPADFMGVLNSKASLIECKSSDYAHSFADCNLKGYIEPTQFAYHKLWVKQKGQSLFVFHSVPMNLIEVWKGEDVLKAYSSSEALGLPLATCDFNVKKLAKVMEVI